MNTIHFFIRRLKVVWVLFLEIARVSPLIRGAREDSPQTIAPPIISPLIRGARGVIQDKPIKAGFSVVGVLVASSMGIIVLLGLSQMLSNMQSDMSEFKKEVNQKVLGDQIHNLLSENCRQVLKNSLEVAQENHQLEDLQGGGSEEDSTKAIQFSILKDGTGATFLDIAGSSYTTEAKKQKHREKLKRLYALEGHSLFQLSCKDGDPPNCDCSSSSSCEKDWLLSLFTQSYKNNLPVYTEVFRQALKIAYTGSDPEDFECRFSSGISSPSLSYCPDDSDTENENSNSNCSVDLKSSDSLANFFGAGSGRYATNGGEHFGSGSGHGACEDDWRRVSGHNTLFGRLAGKCNETSGGRSLFGYQAGLQVAEDNNITAFGYRAARYIGNSYVHDSSFFGFKAGEELCSKDLPKEQNSGNSASNLLNIANVIYGYKQGSSNNEDYDHNKYPLDNDGDPIQGVDIHGQLKKCDYNGKNCKKVLKAQNQNSSREYKKNIVPFRDYEGALELLLASPLFTYQYKEDHPEKERMGVIAEELPEILQLPTNPVQPDWPSIYGHLWAGIKALHKEMQELPLNPPSPPYQGGNPISELYWFDFSFQVYRHSSYCGNPEKYPEFSNKTSIKVEIQQLGDRFEKVKNETSLLQTEFQTYQQRAFTLKREIEQIKQRQSALIKELKSTQKQIQNFSL